MFSVNQEYVVQEVAKRTGLAVEEVQERAEIFDNPTDLFNYIFIDEIEDRNELVDLIQQMSTISQSDFLGNNITVAEKMVADHDNVIVVDNEDGEIVAFVYLPQ